MKEFDLIESILMPLAEAGPPAFGLRDDAAVLRPVPGTDIVATKDMMVAGVHFFPDDAPELVARKLLRINLSDLAAMGAAPVGYLLGLAFAEGIDETFARRFARGLARDQQEFGCTLLGGDTVAGAGRLVLSLTALGRLPQGTALRRAGAKPGDLVFVSGTIGDAALALLALRGEGDADPALTDRYYLPMPRLALGEALRGLATAAIDVSDGLAADLGHLCHESGAGAEIDVTCLPLSATARARLDAAPDLIATVLGGGDDYELVFTAPATRRKAVAAAAARAGVAVREIGRITAQEGVSIRAGDGSLITLDRPGFEHR